MQHIPVLGLQKANSDNNVVTEYISGCVINFLRFKDVGKLDIVSAYTVGIYVNRDNLAVFSPFKEWDPELEWYKYTVATYIQLWIAN
jgi:hypothetical protein